MWRNILPYCKVHPKKLELSSARLKYEINFKCPLVRLQLHVDDLSLVPLFLIL